MERSGGPWQSFGTANAHPPWGQGLGCGRRRQGIVPTPQGCCEGTVPAPVTKSVPESSLGTALVRHSLCTGKRKVKLGEEQVHEESTGRG